MIDGALRRYDEHMLAVQLQPALVAVWDIVARANHYLVEKEPWKLAKDPANRDELGERAVRRRGDPAGAGDRDRADHAASGRRRSGPSSGSSEPLDDQRLPAAGAWGGLAVGTTTTKGESLFPRLEAG